MDVKKLEKLKELKDKGILSEKEFDKQVMDYINASDENSEEKRGTTNSTSNLKIKHIVYLVIIGIVFYIAVETIFPKQIPCKAGISEKQCECVRLNVARNVSFLGKIKMLAVGASAAELSSYIDLTGALRCSLVSDDEESTKSNNDKNSSITAYSQPQNDDITCSENGYCKSYYENGNLKFEGNIIDGKLDGLCTWYYTNGNIQSEGNYSNDKVNGIHKKYYENGILHSEYTFKEGKRNGISKEYYENGILLFEGDFKNDVPNGVIKVYYDNGHLSSEEEFKNGKRDGNVRHYYDDGTLQSSSAWNKGEKAGLTIYYNQNGSKIPSNSHVVFYYSNGNIESEFMLQKNGKVEGIMKRYYTNGTLRGILPFQNDKLNGEIISYNMDGSIKSKTLYKDGKIQ